MYKAALRDWTASENQINNQIQPGYAGSYYANGFQGIPQIQQGFYGAYQQPPVQQGGYQFTPWVFLISVGLCTASFFPFACIPRGA